MDPSDVALPYAASVVLICRQITNAGSTDVPTRTARELHPGGDSYVEHYNSFLGHHHDDDLIRSNLGTNRGTDHEAVCICVD